MTPVSLLLKLNDHFGLTDTIEQNKLNIDAKAWEKECVPDSKDKLKSAYAKYFFGNPLYRLLLPLLYFYLLRLINEIMNPEIDDID